MASCIFHSLSNPMLKGLLLGLDQNKGFELQPDFFPCCAAKGEYYDSKRDAILRCSLLSRLTAVKELLRSYEQAWGKNFQGIQLSAQSENLLLGELSDALKGYSPQLHIHTGVIKTPSRLWPLALAAAWRFGASVYFRTMSQSNPKLFPEPQRIQSEQPMAIFLEQVGALWVDKNAYEFESLLSFAYKTNSFLWIEFAEEPKVPSNQTDQSTLNVSSQFKARLNAIKRKSPESLLSSASRSMIDQMSRLPRTTPDY